MQFVLDDEIRGDTGIRLSRPNNLRASEFHRGAVQEFIHRADEQCRTFVVNLLHLQLARADRENRGSQQFGSSHRKHHLISLFAIKALSAISELPTWCTAPILNSTPRASQNDERVRFSILEECIQRRYRFRHFCSGVTLCPTQRPIEMRVVPRRIPLSRRINSQAQIREAAR